MSEVERLLGLLHHDTDPTWRTSVNWKREDFTCDLVAPAAVTATVGKHLDADVWIGAQPLLPTATKRGTTSDVAALVVVYADLDIEPTKMPTEEAAWEVVQRLSDLLGVRPAVVVHTGHGLHPWWPLVEPWRLDDDNRADASALLKSWGGLVAQVAAEYGGKVDSVYDLPRILRAPGTYNLKQGDNIAVVCTWTDETRRLDLDLVREVITRHLQTPPRTPVEACVAANVDVQGFMDGHTESRAPGLLRAVVARFTKHATHTRHGPMTEAAAWAFREAAAGVYPARDAYEALEAAYAEVKPDEPPSSFPSIAAWAISQAQTADPAVVRAGVDARLAAMSEGEDACTDTGNADALVATFGHLLRHCHGLGWLGWDGTRWGKDQGNATARELVKDLARAMDECERHPRHRDYSLSGAGTTNALRQAQSDPALVVSADDLDADAWVINTPSGVVDLRTGKVMPHDSSRLLTRITPVDVDMNGQHPRWSKFLADTFDDQSMIDYVQRLAGLALIGEVLEHVLPFSYGSGANGKSVLADVFAGVLGAADHGGYAAVAPDGFLSAKTFDSHPTEVARMRGARFVVAHETDGARRFDEARIKRLTGGDRLSGRFMRQDLFDFTPSHLLWVLGNARPEVANGGPAWWRRVKVIPFLHVVPDDEQIPALAGLLVSEEGPAILGWMAKGAMAYVSCGLADPDPVSAATNEYAMAEDPLQHFVAERLDITEDRADFLSNSEVNAAYHLWCLTMDYEPIGNRQLTARLAQEYGLHPIRTRTARGLDGVRLVRHTTAGECA